MIILVISLRFGDRTFTSRASAKGWIDTVRLSGGDARIVGRSSHRNSRRKSPAR